VVLETIIVCVSSEKRALDCNATPVVGSDGILGFGCRVLILHSGDSVGIKSDESSSFLSDLFLPSLLSIAPYLEHNYLGYLR
jgi:hypothetical protein